MIYNKKTLARVISTIEELKIDTDKIIIVGSFALCAYGLLKSYDDIDIVPIFGDKNLGEKRFNKFDLVVLNDGNATRCTYSTLYLYRNNFKINILDEDMFEDIPLIKVADNIYLYPPLEILKVKAKFNRPKDLNHFEEIKNVINKSMEKK